MAASGAFGNNAEAVRDQTRPVVVGGVVIGGGAPVVVQSMLSTPTEDVTACLAQIAELKAAGCELARVAIPANTALAAFGRICEASSLPVIADIHFDFRLALEAVRLGAAKLRINPGNIGDWDMVDAIIEVAGAAGVPIRIGVNAGSLAGEFAERSELTLPEKLAASASSFVEHFEGRGFTKIVLSAKAHDVRTTVDAYRLLSCELPHVPLHLGVTEAGTLEQGTVKSAVGLGALLLDGMGDTLRVSLTASPVQEVRVAWELLSACGLRRRTPELISCPTCGRCKVDLITIANEVHRRLQGVPKPLAVAVMGCIVNGPGEARDADVGVACGTGKGAIFSEGKVLYTVDEEQIVDALFEEIDRFTAQSD
ncbi:MAG: flavodoxin-dependent (E)-4-hydroxy-3-methylbut-2-enyl-diphosphate synthase [Coriobacteriales bacterium]|nr:flavodoxin-dependent (E)-4-hydroxy-3-methylbut-2-enyl-diphosphate synthase [Coriobacteriales bacterium]